MNFSAKDLEIGYSNKLIINDINFELTSGDFVVLVGNNGSGKSTLLKTLSGIISKKSGNIFIDEQTIKPEDIHKYISIVLTDKLEINLSVKEVLSLGRQAFTNRFDQLTKNDEKIIKEIINLLNINNLTNRNITELSDGEHQKVMIGRALVQDTPIILLDEPTTHLDLENKAELIKLLMNISKKKNKIVIFSTHEINLVLPILSKIWLITKNKFREIKNNNINELITSISSDIIKYDKNCKQFKLN